jgi:hypothetical protein
MDARRAPERIRGGHPSDQGFDLGVDGRATHGWAAREFGPVVAEAVPLPSQEGVRRHDHEGLPSPGPGPGERGPEETIRSAQARPWHCSLIDDELLAQGQVFEGELSMAATEERQKPKHVEYQGDHRAGIAVGSTPRDQLLDGRASFGEGQEYEVIYENGQAYRLHLGCAALWDAARRRQVNEKAWSEDAREAIGQLRDRGDVLAREAEAVIEESQRVKRGEPTGK